MGKRKRREQQPMWVAASELPTSPGHPFYARLNRVLDAEGFRHGDLHTFDVIPVPHRFQHGVGEPQVQDFLEPHLPEVVINPVQLRLVDVLVEFIR